DLEQGNIGAWISADFLCLVFSQLRAEPDHDFFRARDDMISRENVSIRANDHAGPEALQRLFALPLRKLSAEKLSQRVVRKRKRLLCPRDRLSGEYSNHAGRHLLDDRGESCDNSRLSAR